MPKQKLPVDTAKTRHISVRASNKESYLIKLAARELQITESALILKAIREQLTPEAMHDEPYAGETIGVRPPLLLYNEGLWEPIKSDRLFKLAVCRPDLLTPNERRFFTLYSMYMESSLQPIGVETFRKFYNSDGIDTSHLSEAGE